MNRRNFIALMFGALVARVFPSTSKSSTPISEVIGNGELGNTYGFDFDGTAELVTYYSKDCTKDYYVLTWSHNGFAHEALVPITNTNEKIVMRPGTNFYCYPSIMNDGSLRVDYPDGKCMIFAPTYTKEL